MAEIDTPLHVVLSELYDSEINAGVSSFWDAGFTVWIGDDMNGKQERSYHRGTTKTSDFPEWSGLWWVATNWLHEQAIKRYPQSVYARRHTDTPDADGER